MNWRETLATRRAHSAGKGPVCVLTKPAKGAFGSFGSMQDARLPAKTAPATIRARLLELAEVEGLPAALIIDMDADDLAAWAWFADQPDGTAATLRACLRTLAGMGASR